MKKIICLLLILITIIPFSANAQLPWSEYTICAFSDVVNEDIICRGVYMDNAFYMSAKDLMLLLNGTIETNTASRLSFSIDNGTRHFYSEKGNMLVETSPVNDAANLPYWSFQTDIPCFSYKGCVYVSCLHFLNYIGEHSYLLSVAGDPHLSIYTHENLYAVLYDYADKLDQIHFIWEDLHLDDDTVTRMIEDAHDIAVLNRTDGWIDKLLNIKNFDAEIMSEVLIEIIGYEGSAASENNKTAEEHAIKNLQCIQRVSHDSAVAIELFNTFYTPEEIQNGIKLLAMTTNDNALDAYARKLVNDSENLLFMDSIASFLEWGMEIGSAIDAYKVYTSVAEDNRNLLNNTFISRMDECSYLSGKDAEVLRKAIQNTDFLLESEENAEIFTSFDILAETISSTYNTLSAPALITPYMLIPAAGETIVNGLLNFMKPDAQENFYKAHCAIHFANAAKELMEKSNEQLLAPDFPSFSNRSKHAIMEDLKSAVIMHLKAGIMAREYLIESGFIHEYTVSRLCAENETALKILRSMHSCILNCAGYESSSYNNDLSWMAEFDGDLTGHWVIDAEKTAAENSIGFDTAFGSDFDPHKSKIIINEDNEIRFSIPGMFSGEGRCIIDGYVLRIKAKSGSVPKYILIHADTKDPAEVRISTKAANVTVYWKREITKPDIGYGNISMQLDLEQDSGYDMLVGRFDIDGDGYEEGLYMEYPGDGYLMCDLFDCVSEIRNNQCQYLQFFPINQSDNMPTHYHGEYPYLFPGVLDDEHFRKEFLYLCILPGLDGARYVCPTSNAYGANGIAETFLEVFMDTGRTSEFIAVDTDYKSCLTKKSMICISSIILAILKYASTMNSVFPVLY